MAKLSIGPAIPSWDFGSGSSSVSLSSHAVMGTSICGEVTYFQNFNIGYTFMFLYNINPVNTDKLSEAYMNSSPAFTSVNSESQAFRDLSGLGGIVIDLPLNDLASLTFRMMGGLRNIRKPAALVNTTTVFSAIDYYEAPANDIMLAFLFSSGGKFVVSEQFNIHVDVSYIGSTFDLTYLRNRNKIEQEAHLANTVISLGVSYLF